MGLAGAVKVGKGLVCHRNSRKVTNRQRGGFSGCGIIAPCLLPTVSWPEFWRVPWFCNRCVRTTCRNWAMSPAMNCRCRWRKKSASRSCIKSAGGNLRISMTRMSKPISTNWAGNWPRSVTIRGWASFSFRSMTKTSTLLPCPAAISAFTAA